MTDTQFHTIVYQAKALSAALTALIQVQQLASQGRCDGELKQLLYASLLQTDATHPDEIYPDNSVFNAGAFQLTALVEQGFDLPRRQLLGYLVAANKLAKELMANAPLQAKLKSEITILKHSDYANGDDNDCDSEKSLDGAAATAEQATELIGENPLALDQKVARIYENTLSTLPYRIHINGTQRHLERESIRTQVRALLLTAIRALVLWRQLGGNALQLLLKRNAYAQICKQAVTAY